MGDKSKIEWTDATWNVVTGCSKVSPGCARCYAERDSHRFGITTKPWTPANVAENVVLHPERLDIPLHWKRPRLIFVCSVSDLFHPLVPLEFIVQVWRRMAACPRHTFQVLTKRPERMAEVVSAIEGWPGVASVGGWPLPNVWCGTSIENDRFVGRAEFLRRTPAAVRFISAEPLLGPLPSLRLGMPGGIVPDVDWLIIGGESGPGHRPMDPRWVRPLILHAVAAGTAVNFKQWGGLRAGGDRLVDGALWDEFPKARGS